MAHTNGNGAAAMERAAESVTMRFYARASMVFFPPLILAALAWFATRQDETTRAVIEIRGQLAPIIRQQDVMQQQIEGNRAATTALERRVDAHVGRHDTADKRLGDIETRNREQDTEIRDIQRRVWRMPESAPPVNAPRTEPFEPYPPPGRPR